MKNKAEKNVLTPAMVEAGTKAQREQEAHSAQIKQLGTEIVKATIAVGDKYLALCEYIRTNNVAPKLATFELLEIGFHKARVSEIVRVSHSSDEIWNQFKARNIGFRKVLELSRGNVQELIAESDGVEVVEIKATIQESNEADTSSLNKEQDNDSMRAKRVENAAKTILTYGQLENKRKLSWTLGTGWTLNLTRDVGFKVKQSKKKSKIEAAKKPSISPEISAGENQEME